MVVKVQKWGNHFIIYIDSEIKFILVQIRNSLYMINDSDGHTEFELDSYEEGLGSLIAGILETNSVVQIEMLT